MCAQLIADLHVHTTASDGTLEVDGLPAAAAEAGLEWIAVTDHDLVHPDLSDPVGTYDGVNVIRGIELRVQDETQRIDLLGYGVEPTAELREEIRRLQTDRLERTRRIVDRVEHRAGVEIDVTFEEGVGRPHVARAIEASDTPYDYDDAFSELIGDDCPCYVPRAVTPLEKGARLLKDACRVVGLAHPLRYGDPEAALERTAGLDAVERYYPYETPVETAIVDDAIERYDLLPTGGSDAHGTTLGASGLSETSFEAFQRRVLNAG